MLEGLFMGLRHAVEGNPGMALGASFLWGLLSVLLSPCHIGSIPLIVGFIDDQGRISTQRAFFLSALFALGNLITIAAIGVGTAFAGRLLGDIGPYGNYFVAVIFFLVGLHLLDVIPNPLEGPGEVGMKRRGLLAAFLLGLFFGLALGPCSFGFMAPMLAVTFKLGASELEYGILLLAMYGLGHCTVIALAGTFTEVVQHYLQWTEASRGAILLKRICGILVLLAGLWMLYLAP